MHYEAKSPEEYIAQLPKERRESFTLLRNTILENLPEGFSEEMSYGMIGYVVSKDIYPPGYHVNPELPLPLINIASQKNFIALYHFGIYVDEDLHDWFISMYPKYNSTKLDMGKSCIRFKNIHHIPYELIGKLVTKLTSDQWIRLYESSIKKKSR